MRRARAFPAFYEITRTRGKIFAEKIRLAHQGAGEVLDGEFVLLQFAREARRILETSFRGILNLCW
jgi:hypothetical protein